jgi:uncharacterized protein with ParB-like and HNH nuclease domain
MTIPLVKAVSSSLDEPETKIKRDEVSLDLINQKLDEESGVEYEETQSSDSYEKLVQPFDPSQVRIEIKSTTVDLLIKRIREGEINLKPDFQRMGGIWRDEAQSRLIESMLIRIPLPGFYIDASDDENWLVIDGLQRLTTLKRFMIDKTLKLQKLEFWQEYNGKTFDELPRSHQRRIEETQLTLYMVQKGTPHNVKFNIFKRINTGGVPLSGQEIRHALNLGVATQLLIELANSEEFKKATDNSVSVMRMTDRECIMRFLAFTLRSYRDYKSSDELDPLLNDCMKEINEKGKDNPTYVNALKTRFKQAMIRAKKLLNENTFRKILPSGRRSPVSKALFEVWSVNLDQLNESDFELLLKRKDRIIQLFKELMIDPSFVQSISYSTGDVRQVRYRFSKIEAIIQETLKDA